MCSGGKLRMWKGASVLVLALMPFLALSRDPDRNVKRSFLFPRAIKHSDPSRGNRFSVGNPADWSMSKANLVAEFYTTEPEQPLPSLLPHDWNRPQKNVFLRNNSRDDVNYRGIPPPQGNSRIAPIPYRNLRHSRNPGGNLMTSETNYVPQATYHNHGGFATPFRPVIKFPQQNYIIPANLPESGYPQNLRPPDTSKRNVGPGTNWEMNMGHINGLRPPPPDPLPNSSNQQQSHSQQHNPPPASPEKLYLPPPGQPPPSPPRSQYAPPPQSQSVPNNNYLPLQQTTPSPPPKIEMQQFHPQKFVPSQEYLPPRTSTEHSPAQTPLPPQILDTYRKQVDYPPPPQSERPLVIINSTRTGNSFTNYEEENSASHSHPPISPQAPSSSQTELTLTEPLSQILADANEKAGEAMEKTIRFVIHKPEDENVVKNAILEDAQTRYEDVRFVNGPTLKVQRKETVYLPPKKKTVVYILLKEPQIDTDVQVMTPDEEDPVPEVYITYQKSDGNVKTKHYSPKPIREEDMKKYIDSTSPESRAEESIIQPRFAKATSVSLSTSSKSSRMSHTMSTSKEDRDKLPEMKPSPLLYSQVNNVTRLDDPLKKSRRSSQSPSPLNRRILRTTPQCATVPSTR